MTGCEFGGAVRRHREVEELAPIVRLEARRRFTHEIEIEVVHAGLVQNHVRHFGEAVLHVLDAAAADDLGAVRLVRLPERRLVDEIGLPQDAVGDAEGLEHLHRTAGDAVGLTKLDRSGLLVDDRNRDVGKGGELRRQRQAGRPAADDQDVDGPGQGVHAARPGKRRGDVRVAGSETIEKELHGASPFPLERRRQNVKTRRRSDRCLSPAPARLGTRHFVARLFDRDNYAHRYA